jgi:hypothetical protein
MSETENGERWWYNTWRYDNPFNSQTLGLIGARVEFETTGDWDGDYEAPTISEQIDRIELGCRISMWWNCNLPPKDSHVGRRTWGRNVS